MEEVNKIKDAADIVPSIVYQPIPTEMTQQFSKNGGNPLGLAGSGPLNSMSLLLFTVYACAHSEQLSTSPSHGLMLLMTSVSSPRHRTWSTDPLLLPRPRGWTIRFCIRTMRHLSNRSSLAMVKTILQSSRLSVPNMILKESSRNCSLVTLSLVNLAYLWRARVYDC